MRVLFTGGSGKAGRHAIAHLVVQGHEVTNLDLRPLGHPDVPDLRVDLTDGAQVFNALASAPSARDLDRAPRGGPSPYDAVVHFAAIPSMFLAADTEIYRVNVLSTFHILDAATKLGLRKIVIASSETAYGICFAQGEARPLWLPVDEDHPTVPQDSYAISKVVNEATARGFQARSGAEIYALRINNVIEPQDYAALAPVWRERPETRRRNIFGYIDARDLGQMVERCLAAEGLGWQVFNVANADSSVAIEAAEVIARFYDGVPLRRPIAGHETFYDIAKARRMLGFEPRHGWRDG
jgi:nucleoside-diphosphate-sugar epimerase